MELDHIGIVVKEIGAALDQYGTVFKLTRLTEVIADERQRVWVQFFSDQSGVRWELIQPMDERSPSWNALKRGGGLNHFCYRTADIEECIRALRREHCVLVCPPTPGAGHEGRRIAFLVSPELGLVELVEAPPEKF